MSKEGSKEFVDVISLELSLDNSLAKGPRTLRCCHVHGLIPTDQYEVVASLIYAGQCWSMLVNAGQCQSMPVDAGQCWSMPVNTGQCRSLLVSIYKTGIYLNGLNLTDQCEVVACLIYAGQCRSMPVGAGRYQSMPADAGRCRSMPVSIYKTGIYLILVSLIQTIKVSTS